MVRRANLFSVPPGAPFLATAAQALVGGALLPGFPNRDDPLSLASATIYVPTRRAAPLLIAEIGRALDSSAFFPPRVLPLGQMEDLEAREGFEPWRDLPDALGEPIDAVERRLGLMRLIIAWRKAVGRAIAGPSLTGGGAPLIADSSGSDWRLAGDLAALIDEFIIEKTSWTSLERIVPESFDRYWSLTLDFLRIAGESWPQILKERERVEQAHLRAALIESEALRVARDLERAGPIFAFGSTGTNRATAALLAAISRSPRGAVVLPGLDRDLDAGAWRILEEESTDCAGHPQSALRRLLAHVGVTREEVAELGYVPSSLRARAAFVSQALLPAVATEKWRAFDRSGVSAALFDVAFVEAENEREEALAIALRLRQVLESAGATAALVTPDRKCATRVMSELERWGVELTDSAGESLNLSTRGTQAQLALAAASAGDLSAESLALLHNRLTRLGFERDRLDALAHVAEIALFRRSAPQPDMPALAIEAARALAGRGRLHPALLGMTDDDWRDAELLFDRLKRALDPLRAHASAAPLAKWVSSHRDCLALLDAPESPADPRAVLLDDFFDRLAAAPDAQSIWLDAVDYAALFGAAIRDVVYRRATPHPRLQILGLLEARLIAVDHVVLAGLDEALWPPSASLDPFLNRAMRAQIGLSPPERRIGQTAHDFTQLLGSSSATLCRARKRGGSPATPSRFIQRMEALAGREEWRKCRERGDYWLTLARLIDRPTGTAPVAAPQPRPPVAIRPSRLSVTRIETLRRDPYAIYAESILRLQPLARIGAPLDARNVGEALHAIIAEFARSFSPGAPLDESMTSIELLALERFAPFMADAEWRAFNWPRLNRMLGKFVEWDSARRDGLEELILEKKGELIVALADGSPFKLTAVADRLERRADRSWTILDFKSGKPPSPREVNCGFAPQLTIECAMLERGAFATSLSSTPSEALYVQLGGQNPLAEQKVGAGPALGALAAEHFDGLIALLSQFRNSETPYLSRPFPQFASRYGDYDHLARVKEWSIAGADEDAA